MENLAFHFTFIFNVEWNIRKCVNQKIQTVYNQDTQYIRKCRADGRKEKGPKPKEHIIRIYRREVHKVCRYGHNDARDCRNKQVFKLLCIGIAMITGKQHSNRAEYHSAVVGQCMEACKGNAGIIT